MCHSQEDLGISAMGWELSATQHRGRVPDRTDLATAIERIRLGQQAGTACFFHREILEFLFYLKFQRIQIFVQQEIELQINK